LRETVAVYCENHREQREREKTNWGGSDRHYHVGGGVIETEFGSLEGSQAVPASPSRKGEHTDTLRGQNVARSSQETHCVSVTEPNRLMLFGEIVAVYCENHTEHRECSVFGVLRELVHIEEKILI
jgi:hypothetical protein